MQRIRRQPIRGWSFVPNYIVQNVADIDFDRLAQHGIKAIFVDLDGTVVERNTYVVHELIQSGLKKQKLKVYIATNRPASKDLRDLRDLLNASGVIHPKGIFGKPFKRYYRQGLKSSGLKPSQVVMVGDRYVQDVFGANRAGLWTIVVRKLGEPLTPSDRLISYIERQFTAYLSRRAK